MDKVHPAEKGIFIINKAMKDLALVKRELEAMLPRREKAEDAPMPWTLPTGRVIDIREERKKNRRRKGEQNGDSGD